MPRKENGVVPKKNLKPKPPIKVEKIVDIAEASTREIYAIIIGVLIVLALAVGSVVYFSGSSDPLAQKPVDKTDDVIEILDDENKPVIENEEEKINKPIIKKLNKVVSKECKTCSVIVLETLDKKINKDHEYYDSLTDKDQSYFKDNNLESKTYYKEGKNSYLVVIKGTLTTKKEDKGALSIVNKVVAYKKAANEAPRLVLQEQKDEVLERLDINVLDLEKNGLIVVSSEDTTYASHVFVVRIEEKKKVDWSKGVTVNGTTYNETVLDTDNQYLYQDENGVNITVMASKNDLGNKPKNKPIVIDIKYTTAQTTTEKAVEKKESYELDLTEVSVKYEDVSSLSSETDLTEHLDTAEKTNDYLQEAEEDLNEYIYDEIINIRR